MVTYQVALTVDAPIQKDFHHWMVDEHIPKVLLSPGFLRAQFLSDSHNDGAEKVLMQVLYYVKDEESLDRYLLEHAPIRRDEGLERWPKQFSAQREVWFRVEDINRPFVSV